MTRSFADILKQPITLKTGIATVGALWLEHFLDTVGTVTPQYLKERLAAFNVISADGGLTIERPATAEVLARVSGDDDRRQTRLAIEAIAAAGRYDRIAGVLQLAPQETVRKRTTLPAAARENVHEAVGYQIDVETPFSSNDVYYGTRILFENSTAIAVEVVVALRSVVDRHVAKIEEQGLPIESIHADRSQGDPIVLLKRPIGRPARVRRQIYLAGALTAGLIAVMAAIPLAHKEFQAVEMQNRAELDMRAAAPIIAAQMKLNAKLESKAELAKVVQRFPDPVQVLAALTKSVPTDTWLTRFAMRDGEIQISGLTPSTSALIDELAQAEMFFPPVYAAPAVLDPQFDRERFVLNLRLRPGL